MDDFVCFLRVLGRGRDDERTKGICTIAVSLPLVTVRWQGCEEERKQSLQLALKHSWEQKKEPLIPSLVGGDDENLKMARAGKETTDLLQVGHSRREGGRLLMQEEDWQGTFGVLIVGWSVLSISYYW